MYGPATAIWLPEEVLADVPEDAMPGHVGLLLEHLKEMVDQLPGQLWGGGSITSCSIAPARLAQLKDRVRRYFMPHVNELIRGMAVVSSDDLVVEDPPASVRTVCSDVFERSIPIGFDEGVASQAVTSFVPSVHLDRGTALAGNLKGNWVADVVVGRCKFPVRRDATTAAELDDSRIEAGLVRTSRTGTSWIAVTDRDVPGMLHVDAALHTVSLRDPDMRVILDSLVPAGWTWQLSDAGRFYQGLSDMLGGLDQVVGILRDHTFRAVVDEYLSPAPAKGAARPEIKTSLYLSGARRRFMTLDQCVAAANSSDRDAGDSVTAAEVRTLVDRLLRQRVLVRGLALKCDRCLHTDFQPLDGIGRGFRCGRCLSGQPLVAQSWFGHGPDEPNWHYGMDELAYRAMDRNVEGPALALAALRADLKMAPGVGQLATGSSLRVTL